LGYFTRNDAKVYLTLVNYGFLNPADISKYSSVDRARVYDSLNRLVEKNFVQKEPIKRGAGYKAKPPSKVFSIIREELKNKVHITNDLEEKIKKLKPPEEKGESRVWSIESKDNIRNKIVDLIDKAKERINFIITPDLVMGDEGYKWLTEELYLKRFKDEKVNIVIALSVFPDVLSELKRLLKLGIEIYKIIDSKIVPFGLLIADNEFLLTTLDHPEELPEYNTGLWLEGGSKGQIIGYMHLFNHFISSECKKGMIIKKTKDELGKMVEVKEL